ncbi:hypothetical protein K4H02_27270, partial [Mycobacterium tuberculosis]|nr:hypothetical protein [Mycobacterium tuberculosis]
GQEQEEAIADATMLSEDAMPAVVRAPAAAPLAEVLAGLLLSGRGGVLAVVSATGAETSRQAALTAARRASGIGRTCLVE